MLIYISVVDFDWHVGDILFFLSKIYNQFETFSSCLKNNDWNINKKYKFLIKINLGEGQKK